MPYDISHPTIQKIHREWKKTTALHNSYAIKNEFHQQQRMDDWTNELRDIDTAFRKCIENAEKDLEREEAERYAMEQEETEMREAIAREKRNKRNAKKETKPPAVPTRISRRILARNWN